MKLPAQSVRDRYKQTSGALDSIAIPRLYELGVAEAYRKAADVVESEESYEASEALLAARK